jgi:hypothetical protein
LTWVIACLPSSDAPRLRHRRSDRTGGAATLPLRRGSVSLRHNGCMQRDRAYVALVEDEPSFTPRHGKDRVAFDRYDIQRPASSPIRSPWVPTHHTLHEMVHHRFDIVRIQRAG